ncbi:MAG TPA: hypothetical protein VFK89_11265 [Actinomycetota bacterium]|nr:hypothetical protein [Actinomycetota bacterium]
MKRVLPRFVLLLVTLALLFGGWSMGTAGQSVGSLPVSDTASTPSSSPSTTSTSVSGGVTAGGGGGGTINNEVVVINSLDGRSASRVGSGIARVTGDTAENQNAAVAQSSCMDCRTVAVAVQIVLVQRNDASNISPRNYAMALNQGCSGCQSFAGAYQYVVTTDGIVRFTAAGQQRLADLETQLRGLVASDTMTFPELDSRIRGVVQQMWSVVDNELALVGVQGQGVAHQDVDVEEGDPSASPTESPSPGAPADPTATESPTPAASDEPTPAESPSPSSPADESPSPSPSESSP